MVLVQVANAIEFQARPSMLSSEHPNNNYRGCLPLLAPSSLAVDSIYEWLRILCRVGYKCKQCLGHCTLRHVKSVLLTGDFLLHNRFVNVLIILLVLGNLKIVIRNLLKSNPSIPSSLFPAASTGSRGWCAVPLPGEAGAEGNAGARWVRQVWPAGASDADCARNGVP